ncbi:S41 family peptidase [Thermodesulfobacteriota bacterium]
MTTKKRSVAKRILLFAAICIPATITILLWQHPSISARTQDTYKNLEIFADVLNIIQKNYVEDVDTQQVIEGAIRGMLTTLDPHSSYMKPDDFKELQVETKGSFSGIGIEITMKDNILTVVSPIEGTPAFKQGLQAGDKIVKIENEPTNDMSLMQAVKKLRGVKGSKVTISIHRKGWSDLKDVTIIRDVIPIHSVRSQVLEPGYGYARITSFQSKTARDLKKALEELTEDAKLEGLILDLRNNPGGLLDQAVQVSDLFVDEGVIVSTEGRIKEQNMIFEAHADKDNHFDFPMVILVNEGSASASEIVAGALKDHKRALILGAQTFGKGSVQTIIPMADGAGLRLTTARYFTPSGTSIQATGITPDILVATVIPNSEDKKTDDIQKQPKFLREKDLKHHIENGNGTEKDTEKDSKKSNGDAKKKEATKNIIDEKLQKDRQLNTALMLLKGVNVFGNLEKR